MEVVNDFGYMRQRIYKIREILAKGVDIQIVGSIVGTLLRAFIEVVV